MQHPRAMNNEKWLGVGGLRKRSRAGLQKEERCSLHKACRDASSPGPSPGNKFVCVSKTDVKLKGICKGWRPRLVSEGIWALKSVLEHSCFTFQTLSMAYLTGMLSR